MTTPIWFDSTETGAPTLNNVAGSLLEVLRAYYASLAEHEKVEVKLTGHSAR